MLSSLPNTWGWTYTNADTTSLTPGTSVVPTTNNTTPTTFTQIASAANMANDSYGMLIGIFGGNTTGTIKNHALTIGVDLAGGTTYTAVISNILCGQTGAFAVNGGYWIYLPYFIKAGSSVGVRVQGSAATAGTVLVVAKFFGQPSRPETLCVGGFSETLGFTAASTTGAAFTPGTNAEGTYATIGTTTRDLFYLQLGLTINNGTTTANTCDVDLAYGDATNKKEIITNMRVFQVGNAEINGYHNYDSILQGYCHVPAGSTLYVRGRAPVAPATGYSAVAIGIGG